MKLNITAINFDMAQQLKEFINKKSNRFARHLKEDDEVDVRLTVVVAATAHNKEAQVRIGSLLAKKQADTFEEAFSLCLDALDSQLEKRKEK